METGIYESLITILLSKKLEKLNQEFYYEEEVLDGIEAALRLSNFFCKILKISLESLPKDEARIEKQVQLTNKLITFLSHEIKEDQINSNLLVTQGTILKGLLKKINPLSANLSEYLKQITPATGLTQSELFTGNHAGISIESEFKREILSADSIDWIVSFIKFSGIRLFLDELKTITRGGKSLRIITTSYMGATDFHAVDFLSKLPNTKIKISYNTKQERLHAKTYIFLRDNGFHTAYIGSSNLSRSALTAGLEWNLKITSEEIPHIIEKTKNTFETYWQDNEFEEFNPSSEESSKKLKQALKQARNISTVLEPKYFLDIQPHMHQRAILDLLGSERKIHNRWRNLVVAATGTGKTIISAFDFQKYYQSHPDAKLLFVAHREEILRQSLSTFQQVLKDSNFGNLWVGNHKPERYEHLFVSVQSLKNEIEHLKLTSDYFDFIVIDEVHHIAAASYRPILAKFSPKILLGLTATPERQDGADILEDFCGRIAAELRLPEAINRRYLSPFHYFGIDDEIDLSQVEWTNGHYDPVELTKLYTSNDRRVFHILQNMETILTDISEIRALAFCVSKEHAKYMAEKFNLNKIKSDVLTSDNTNDREALRKSLKDKKINILCVVDIFNEGVDIPEIDTVLFLRPTESLTIFLQQLGRGLRLSPEKECLTVLDFVGNARPEYDFSQKFRALIGKSNVSIQEEIIEDFPNLPLGCGIVLQKKAKEIILNQIKNAIPSKHKILAMIKNFPNETKKELNLRNFLGIYPSITLEDIYKIKLESGVGWTNLCKLAGYKSSSAVTKISSFIPRAIANRFLTCSSYSYLKFIQTMLRDDFKWQSSDPISSQMASMLYYDFFQDALPKFGFRSIQDAFNQMNSEFEYLNELSEALEVLLDQISLNEKEMDDASPFALKLHARYSRDEILSAFSVHTLQRKSSSREGVVELKDSNLELLFVTLQKNEKHFSPTTRYYDYAISPTLFHWQTQNSARPDRGKGLGYIEQEKTGKKIILFVRENTFDVHGRTCGFINLGYVRYKSHTQSQPMNINWELLHPLPGFLWISVAKLAVG